MRPDTINKTTLNNGTELRNRAILDQTESGFYFLIILVVVQNCLLIGENTIPILTNMCNFQWLIVPFPKWTGAKVG